MRVITLARIPLVGTVASNVLEYGTGALNINASRIGYASKEDREVNTLGLERVKGTSGGWKTTSTAGVQPSGESTGGRWPGNIILSHRAGCVLRGTRQIKTHDKPHAKNVHGTNGQGGQNVYTKYEALPGTMFGHADADGNETVEDWLCITGCPVAALDGQTGDRAATWTNSSTRRPSEAKPSSKFRPNQEAYMPQGPLYADTGGASRYFKHIHEESDMEANVPQELLDYLHTMITPTEVQVEGGGNTLVALNFDDVDWSDHEDASLHGFIGQGTPTEDQLNEMWRALKPGAHVMLIAPEDSPTGHKGACALEDRGFEIRDAILWVREAGHLHYVPKASSRERNAGCTHLAKERGGEPMYEFFGDIDEETIGEAEEKLLELGVEEDVVNAIQDTGIPKSQVPSELWHLFRQKPEEKGGYGNNHPTVKPKDVMKRLLHDVPEGATVLDPFMGSGSMGIACLETGHSYIGIEMQEEYLEIADARIRHWDRTKAGWIGAEIESDLKKEDKEKEEVSLGDLLGF